MKIDFISDTHGYHKKLSLDSGDVLCHCGDIEARTRHGLDRFIDWFSKQAYNYKIFIGGNHDFWLQCNYEKTMMIAESADCIYLQDSSVNIDGITIWGTPWSLNFGNWAFMGTEEQLGDKYAQINGDIDMLLSHSPPKNKLDAVVDGRRVGSRSLMSAIEKHDPKIVSFGHIHESYGEEGKYINCSVLNERYNMVNEPISRHID